jgi:hypothetical protein
VARTEHRADAILLFPARNGAARWDAEETLEAVRGAAGQVPLEVVVVDAEAPAAPSGS